MPRSKPRTGLAGRQGAGGKRLDVGELSGLTVECRVRGDWIAAPTSA